MKIKKLYIEQFGAVSNYSLSFDDEVNIIKLNNEQGKTTISQFIRCMLYGINGGSRNVRDNPRKRYMPWGKTSMGGELLVEHQGASYLIIRTFGIHKSDDRINVINDTTGETLQQYCTDTPGYEITGCGGDAYDKALYLNHFSVNMDSKKDEIMDRLIALSQSGDEEFSYKQACKILDDAINQLNSSRIGKIKQTKEQIDGFYKEMELIKNKLSYTESLKQKNKALEQQENQLKADDFNYFKKYGLLFLFAFVLSAVLCFVNIPVGIFAFVITTVFALYTSFVQRKKSADKINRLVEISREIGKNKNDIDNSGIVDLNAVQKKIDNSNLVLERYMQKLSDLLLTKQSLDDAFEKIQQGFGTQLNENVAEILGVITKGKYDGVKVDKNYEMTVHCADGWQSARYLSDGAYSQIYFSLKMAIVKTIFPDMPVIFDDPFALYDESRQKIAMEYLSNCDNQIILLMR